MLSEVPRGRLPAGWTCSSQDGMRAWGAGRGNCRKAKTCRGVSERVGAGPGPCWSILVNVFVLHTFLSTFVSRLSHQVKIVNNLGAAPESSVVGRRGGRAGGEQPAGRGFGLLFTHWGSPRCFQIWLAHTTGGTRDSFKHQSLAQLW